MIRHTLKTGVACAAILLCTQAFAEDYNDPTSGVYISGAGGLSSNLESDFKSKSGAPSYQLSADFDWGWMASGAVGYDYGNFIRNEVELSYRDNGIDTLQNTATSSGDTKALSLMYNLLFDVNVFGPSFTPYVGAGIGMMRLDLAASPLAGGLVVDDSNWVGAYQGIIGAEYALDNELSLFTDYRYVRSFGADYNTTNGNKGNFTYKNSTVTAGLRYSFGADMPNEATPTPLPIAAPSAPAATFAPSAAVAAPVQSAAPVSRSYNVFFDLDRAKLTKEAASVIRQAAQDAVNSNATGLQVIGHADTSGTPEHNQKLSENRAEAVKAGLAKLGINPSAVQWDARGEKEPLVQTADGVREPQNRRVEIRFLGK